MNQEDLPSSEFPGVMSPSQPPTRPSAGRSSPDRSRPTGPAAGPTAPGPCTAPGAAERPAATPTGSGLTVNQILAGAGAAATSAVAGSVFGAVGTVAGAALGSVVLTIGTTVYQRSLDRTRDVVRARIKVVGTERTRTAAEAPTPRGARTVSGATVRMRVPAPRPSLEDAETVRLTPVRPTRTGARRWRRGAVSAVVAFVLGLFLVTGFEWAIGSTITGGEPGTSVGRVVAPPPAPAEDPGVTPGGDGAPTELGRPDGTDPNTGVPGGGEPGTPEPGSGEPGDGEPGSPTDGTDTGETPGGEGGVAPEDGAGGDPDRTPDGSDPPRP